MIFSEALSDIIYQERVEVVHAKDLLYDWSREVDVELIHVVVDGATEDSDVLVDEIEVVMFVIIDAIDLIEEFVTIEVPL